MNTSTRHPGRERGFGLIVIIMVVAFMMAVGMLLLTVTGTSPKTADSLRLQGMALDAAEAGFNAAWVLLNNSFMNRIATSFSGQYRTMYRGAPGLDQPTSDFYFRGLTDEQLVADVAADNSAANPAIFSSEQLASDPRCSFTVFLVNDEPPGLPNDNDCLIICIGRAPRNTYKRLEILIEVGS